MTAAQSYENAEWIGISASPTASLTLEQEHTTDELRNLDASMSTEQASIRFNNLYSIMKDCFINYDIPTKNGIERNGWALSWPIFYDKGDYYHTQNEVKGVLDEELSYLKYQQSSISNDVYRKFKNTKEFFDFCIKKKLINYDSFKIG